MPTDPTGLAQVGSEPDLVLGITIAVILVVLGYLAVRGLLDKLTGVYDETATYQLIQTPQHQLALTQREDGGDGTPQSLDTEQMTDLVEAVTRRNEMRLHALLNAANQDIAYEDWDLETQGAPNAILIEDSRGLFRITRAGRIEAEPPLDDAVKNDLLDVLKPILEPA